MIEQYISNSEYETYYEELSDLRSRIANDLPIKSGMHILDVATGSGFFAIDVAKFNSSLEIIGIDISQRDIRNAKKNIKRQGLQDRVDVLEMDATQMSFDKGEFDMAINFAGLEDIHMTRGEAGVRQMFLEVNKVLKPNGYFCFVVMPPEEMETEGQKIEVALFSYICDATWLSAKEYEKMLESAKFKLTRKRSYYTGKKLSQEQAKAEIRFACKNVPKIYGINTPPSEEVWRRFGREIEENGLGCYSKVVSMTAQKVAEV